jgi:8-oxo-dGTP diphosphatase
MESTHMANSDQRIRVVARGIIVRDGKVLIIEVDDGAGRWWILPGGKQEFGEEAADTVRRECLEELQCSVEVGPCVMIREFIGPRRKEVVGKLAGAHSIELYFRCGLEGEPDLKPREEFHRQLVWTKPEALTSVQFFPKILAMRLPAILAGDIEALYVGDVD